jgi:hypothetical protein
MTNRSEVRKLYCAVELVPVVEALKLVNIEVETPSLRLHAALCMHYIDDLYHIHHYHYAATGDTLEFHYNIICAHVSHVPWA